MTAQRLPLDALADNPGGVSFQVELVGSTFTVELRYNDRDERYYLGLFDEDGAAIATSIKVVLDQPLLSRVTDPRRPLGEFFAVDVGGGQPTLDTLGDGVDLVFVPFLDLVST